MDGNCSLSDSSFKSDINQDDLLNCTLTSKNSSCCDSQASLISEESDKCSSPQPIPVVTIRPRSASQPSPPPWFEEHSTRPADLPSTRKTIRRDNRLLTGSSLPSFSAPNCRSIGPKLNNIVEDMKMRSISCMLCSETWQKDDSKSFQKEIERLFEMEGLKMISKPRKYRRGEECALWQILLKSVLLSLM